jgi:hypothetical protein
MNLQILAAQAHMRSGAVYDATDPIMNNVMFDIAKLSYETTDKIRVLQVQVDNLRKNIFRYTGFKTIRSPDIMRYENLSDEFADILFDSITYERITTRNQIEWKEYFHGVYDLVVFPYIRDHTHFIQMVNELYKYFDVLKPPEKQLEPGDPLYVDTKACMDLLHKMKSEYRNMTTMKLSKKLNKDVQVQVEKRYRHRMLELKLESLISIRQDCNELIQWTKK